MASGPVNGEVNDGAKEMQSFKVYTRKGRGKRQQAPSVAIVDDREKPETKVKDGDDSNLLNPPEALVEEAVDSIVVDNNSFEAVASGTICQVNAKTSSEEPSENPRLNDSEKSAEAAPQAQVQDAPSVASVDKNTVHPCPGSLAEDNAKAVVVEKPIEVSSESQAQEDVNTVVIDKNSIEPTPPETLAEGDVSTVVVDKNPIEASSQTLSQEGADVVVDKNPIEVPSEEDVNVVDVDNSEVEVPSESLAQQDTSYAPQHAEVPFESVPVPKPLQVMAPSTRTIVTGSALMEETSDGHIRIHLASSSRQQKDEIRKKLEDQLNLVRGLVRKIEAKEGEIGVYSDSRIFVNAGVNNGGGRILAGFASAGTPREVVRASRPLNQLSISVLDNTHGMSEHVEKEKRTPKANQFYRNSEFLLANEKFPPAESNKKSKSSAKKHGEVGHGFGPGSKAFKACSALLERLMKHRHGWVFNAPVDVKGLGLHDYFTIIKHPMDLGTIKSRLTKNWYRTSREFAEDVRLTFRNAMTYNPEGQDVHVMAEQLSKIFEERWAVIEAEYYELNPPTPRSRLAPAMPPPPINVRNMVDRPDWISRSLEQQSKAASTTPSGRTPALKKPKANEPNKRDMTYEEKQKLSANLQNLPPDKLDAIVQIVNKRNTAVKLRDEEIEVDIDSVDPETLWELDRFVTNYKKSLSKKKRKAELAMQARAEAEKNAAQRMLQSGAQVAEELPREGGTAQKSIPIPLHSQAEKPSNNEGSRSSSSSSSTSDSSSSSSDSDSDSSSSSGSD